MAPLSRRAFLATSAGAVAGTALSACGIGEASGASMSGITAGAIFNATGKWAIDYPLTPDRVLKALGTI